MKLRMVLFITLSLLMTCVYAQEKNNYKTETSIHYYDTNIMKGDEYMQQMCVVDIYYPTDIENFPTIVWFHGGGLTSGKREIPDYLKNKGIAVVGVGHRLSPKVKSLECIEDAAAATSWVFRNIENYGGNTSLIFLSGMSAGGYLTYMVG